MGPESSLEEFTEEFRSLLLKTFHEKFQEQVISFASSLCTSSISRPLSRQCEMWLDVHYRKSFSDPITRNCLSSLDLNYLQRLPISWSSLREVNANSERIWAQVEQAIQLGVILRNIHFYINLFQTSMNRRLFEELLDQYSPYVIMSAFLIGYMRESERPPRLLNMTELIELYDGNSYKVAKRVCNQMTIDTETYHLLLLINSNFMSLSKLDFTLQQDEIEEEQLIQNQKITYLSNSINKLNSNAISEEKRLEAKVQRESKAEAKRAKEKARKMRRLERRKEEAKRSLEMEQILHRALDRVASTNKGITALGIMEQINLAEKKLSWQNQKIENLTPEEFLKSVLEILRFKPLLRMLLPIRFELQVRQEGRHIFEVYEQSLDRLNVRHVYWGTTREVQEELFSLMGASSVEGIIRRISDVLTEKRLIVDSILVRRFAAIDLNPEVFITYLFTEIRPQEFVSAFFKHPEYFGVQATCQGCSRSISNWVSTLIYERGPVCGNHNYKIPSNADREKVIEKIVDLLLRKASSQTDAYFNINGFFVGERASRLNANKLFLGKKTLHPWKYSIDSEESEALNKLYFGLMHSDKERFLTGLLDWKPYTYGEMCRAVNHQIYIHSK